MWEMTLNAKGGTRGKRSWNNVDQNHLHQLYSMITGDDVKMEALQVYCVMMARAQ
jgi:hypothetical protein